jgi:hypothetical protein
VGCNPLHLRPLLLVQSFCQESAVDGSQETVALEICAKPGAQNFEFATSEVQKARRDVLRVTLPR